MYDYDSRFQEAAQAAIAEATQSYKEEKMTRKQKYREWKQMMDYCINAGQAMRFLNGKKALPGAVAFAEVILAQLWHRYVIRTVCKVIGHDWKEDDTYIHGRGCGRVDVTCQRCFEHHGGYW